MWNQFRRATFGVWRTALDVNSELFTMCVARDQRSTGKQFYGGQTQHHIIKRFTSEISIWGGSSFEVDWMEYVGEGQIVVGFHGVGPVFE